MERMFQFVLPGDRRAASPVTILVRSLQNVTTCHPGLAAAIKMSAGMRIVKTYEDFGKSGLNLRGRNGLQALLHDVEQPQPGFQAVLVYDISRAGFPILTKPLPTCMPARAVASG